MDRPIAPAASASKPTRSFPAEAMAAYPVSTWVNIPANNDPRCIEPLAAAE
jgi:putative SOS response-associated peptidase YedK